MCKIMKLERSSEFGFTDMKEKFYTIFISTFMANN